MRDPLLRNYIDSEHIYEIMWHSIWIYIEIAAKYCVLLLLAGVSYVYLVWPLWIQRIQRVRAFVWMSIYLKCLYDIFDEYLDVLLITEQWLIHFQWDGFWSHRSEILQRVSIEAVSDHQNSFRDSLVKKWDVTIKLEDNVTKFNNIENPSQVTSKIIWYKEKILWRMNYYENEVAVAQTSADVNDKYKILVEALGEVVNEYVEKKNNTDGMYY